MRQITDDEWENCKKVLESYFMDQENDKSTIESLGIDKRLLLLYSQFNGSKRPSVILKYWKNTISQRKFLTDKESLFNSKKAFTGFKNLIMSYPSCFDPFMLNYNNKWYYHDFKVPISYPEDSNLDISKYPIYCYSSIVEYINNPKLETTRSLKKTLLCMKSCEDRCNSLFGVKFPKNCTARLLNASLIFNPSLSISTWRITTDASRFCMSMNPTVLQLFSQCIYNYKLKELYLKLLEAWSNKAVVTNSEVLVYDVLKKYFNDSELDELAYELPKELHELVGDTLLIKEPSTMSQGMLASIAGILSACINRCISKMFMWFPFYINEIVSCCSSMRQMRTLIMFLDCSCLCLNIVNTSDDGAGCSKILTSYPIDLIMSTSNVLVDVYSVLLVKFGIILSQQKSYFFSRYNIQEFNSMMLYSYPGKKRVIL
jgi:hypothetical protein